ncbi:MAG: hypothetical protein ABW128_21280 [Rhizorhabdus sp.]
MTIVTYDGRYDSITTSPAPDCGRSADNRPGSGGYNPPSSQLPSYPPPRPGYGGNGGYDDYYDRGNSLTLICYGEGRRPASSYRSGYMWDPRSRRYEYRGFIENGTRSFDSEVQIEIRGGRGYIHLTGRLIPPVNSRGENGWWELRDINVARNQITASYRLNGLNKPKIQINRRSGRITIKGIETFRGECDVGDWNGGNRF